MPTTVEDVVGRMEKLAERLGGEEGGRMRDAAAMRRDLALARRRVLGDREAARTDRMLRGRKWGGEVEKEVKAIEKYLAEQERSGKPDVAGVKVKVERLKELTALSRQRTDDLIREAREAQARAAKEDADWEATSARLAAEDRRLFNGR